MPRGGSPPPHRAGGVLMGSSSSGGGGGVGRRKGRGVLTDFVQPLVVAFDVAESEDLIVIVCGSRGGWVRATRGLHQWVGNG